MLGWASTRAGEGEKERVEETPSGPQESRACEAQGAGEISRSKDGREMVRAGLTPRWLAEKEKAGAKRGEFLIKAAPAQGVKGKARA